MKKTPLPKRNDLVKVDWRDACEGDGSDSLRQMTRARFRNATRAMISTTGRFLKVVDGYLILSRVVHEESEGKIFYELQMQGGGKWMSIPIESIVKIRPTKTGFTEPPRRQRMIFKHLRFIPRARRLQSGEISRTLYLR